MPRNFIARDMRNRSFRFGTTRAEALRRPKDTRHDELRQQDFRTDADVRDEQDTVFGIDRFDDDDCVC